VQPGGPSPREQEQAFVVVAASNACASTTKCATSASETSRGSSPRWCAPLRNRTRRVEMIAVRGPKHEGRDGVISRHPRVPTHARWSLLPLVDDDDCVIGAVRTLL
jgi:hypothetical protein